MKNCCGLLFVEYEPISGSKASQKRTLELQTLKSQYVEEKASCKSRIDYTEFYSDLSAVGLQYGPAFTNVCEARNRDGQSRGLVKISDVPAWTPEGCERPHVVHPCTLDAIFHLAFAAVMGKNTLTAMVPKSINEIIVSAHVPWTLGVKLPEIETSAKHGFRELRADILMLDDNKYLPAVDIRGFLCAEMTGGSARNAQAMIKCIISKLIERPVVDLLTAEELQQALGPHRGTEKVAEYVKLLHHSNPALSVLEIASNSSMRTYGDLSNISKTGEVTITCKDAELKAKLDETAHDAFLESLDFTEELSLKSLADRNYDVIVLSDLDLSTHR